ncbi:flagellar assembly peptidoglycan hydrolase FlgJ [Ectothiorhodospira mobilis]|uniref:flagellar assembly peptidoglycan hydrolase FlgJ n=1 Tax=Ectothiorhodospira mobilis TaxID=195064 RepID=UPI001EE796EA|nr:flagellar assembly peptidoglycan hydrolase FlgJ [Ectothiorhodospira mobilis]MCG5535714.1 flagellar assembly peptidoglycan hydrolase FlgJ [Ectothiorhodospira mobilis]
MNGYIADSTNYTDLAGLTQLRARAQRHEAGAADEVARQFEALFIQMMLKSMRQAAPAEGIFNNEQTRMYQGLFDQQIALEMSQGEGIGLREQVMRELSRHHPGADAGNPGDDGQAGVAGDRELQMPDHRVPSLRAAIEAAIQARDAARAGEGAEGDAEAAREVSAADPAGAASGTDAHWRPETPQEFIRDVWPHAQAAARELGVPPEVLVAQSGLETGWGRHVIRHGDGSSSFNLFGIKADARWDGPRVNVSTLEYVDGLPERQRAAFRAYDGLAEGFDDYVAFIQGNPRYRQALEAAGDAEGYIRGLQEAGYATDPRYADKILNIMQRGTLGETLASLKSGQTPPIS